MCQTLVLEHCSAALTISSAFFRVNLLSPTKPDILSNVLPPSDKLSKGLPDNCRSFAFYLS